MGPPLVAFHFQLAYECRQQHLCKSKRMLIAFSKNVDTAIIHQGPKSRFERSLPAHREYEIR